MFNDALAGISHTIPLTTNFKIFKYFSVSTNANYSESWVFNTINKYYNATTNKVETTRINGFDSYRTYNFGASLGTTIYGTYTFKETNKIQAIRHIMRPNVSYGYTPSFNQYYDTYLDQNGNQVDFSRFEGSILVRQEIQLPMQLDFH